MTGLYVDFPLYMQISNSMHYFTSLEVSWLIHAADWKWPLRKILIIQLTHVSCWSQVMDPCLPFLRFTDTIHGIIIVCLVYKIALEWDGSLSDRMI